MKKLLKTNEMLLFLLIVAIALVFGMINPQILTLANFYSLIRSSAIPAIFALSIMLVMCCGGFDMSFAMIGAFSSYVVMFYHTSNGQYETSIFAIFAEAIVIAVVLELFNWVLIDKLNLQPFITTLGTQSLLKGFLLAFISTQYIYTLPNQVAKLGTTYLHTATYEDGIDAQLHVVVIFVVVMYVIMHLILQHTNFGRQIYAVGGDVDAARRAGINVSRVRFLVFVIAGIICGIGGVMHDAVARCSLPLPSDLVGKELNSIAAVVLGMGSQKKARGSVLGTLLGVVLLQFITGNLIMLGIPSYFQQAVSGLLIFAGLIVQMTGSGRKLVRKERKTREA